MAEEPSNKIKVNEEDGVFVILGDKTIGVVIHDPKAIKDFPYHAFALDMTYLRSVETLPGAVEAVTMEWIRRQPKTIMKRGPLNVVIGVDAEPVKSPW